jgi:small subunit ribosomal protein S16
MGIRPLERPHLLPCGPHLLHGLKVGSVGGVKGPVRVRLVRFGRKKLLFYRIFVAHSHARRDGRHIELLGFYNPIAGVPSCFFHLSPIETTTVKSFHDNKWISLLDQGSFDFIPVVNTFHVFSVFVEKLDMLGQDSGVLEELQVW